VCGGKGNALGTLTDTPPLKGLRVRDKHQITSNRALDEWLGLFEDPILGNSVLDRLANASYQIVDEGSSYRERQLPHRALLSVGREGGD